jgi:hypothetical protein
MGLPSSERTSPGEEAADPVAKRSEKHQGAGYGRFDAGAAFFQGLRVNGRLALEEQSAGCRIS